MNVEKYIEAERDISLYELNMLKRIKNLSSSQKKMMKREERFLSIPFHRMGFKTVDEVSAAINLFKDFELKFYKNIDDKDSLFIILREKILYLEEVSKEYDFTRIESINVVQNKHFFDKLVDFESARREKSRKSCEKELSNLDIKELLYLEPAYLSKERARTQAINFSIYLYIKSILLSIDKKINDLDSNELYENIVFIDDAIDNTLNGIFKFYNKALKLLSIKLKNSIGKNNYLGKIHPMVNLVDQYPIDMSPIYNGVDFDKSEPSIGYLMFGLKSAIYNTIHKDEEKSAKNRVYGILLPINRCGNEKKTLFYRQIFLGEKNITNLFCDHLSNIKAINSNGEITYCKALMMKPLWMILKSDYRKNKYILTNIIGIDVEVIKNNIMSKSMASKVNGICSNFLNISKKDSIILVAKTRSEEEGINRTLEFINLNIKNIIDGYHLCY